MVYYKSANNFKKNTSKLRVNVEKLILLVDFENILIVAVKKETDVFVLRLY